jgi:hypothetical protein
MISWALMTNHGTLASIPRHQARTCLTSTPSRIRRNDDGSLLFVTISPGEDGLDFVVTNDDKGRGPVIRDGQHEYRYEEAK